MKVFAELATKRLDESEANNLQNKTTGTVDASKAKNLIDVQNKQIAIQASAIDQLQQRISNIEAHLNRLEVRLPASPPPAPIGVPGWIDNPPKNR